MPRSWSWSIRCPARDLDSYPPFLRISREPWTSSRRTSRASRVEHHMPENKPSPEVISVRFPSRLEINVHDLGSGFDLAGINGDVTSPSHLLDARGRGIYIMRACMDAVDYQFSSAGTVCH